MTTTQQQKLFDVGGLLYPRPFKIRRLGHFGFNVRQFEEAATFYRDLLGFKVSDFIEGRGYFFHYGGDHHAFVLFNRPASAGQAEPESDITINQITWQTGSLAEVVSGARYLREQGVPIRRVGRDMPGSNWHAYVYDPDAHVIELYYGIEQIGWDGRSKPREMYYRRFAEEPSLPQMPEAAEVAEAIQRGIDINTGYRWVDPLPATYDVEGILLPRPFAITKIGPVNLFVRDLESAIQFYTETLGFQITEEVAYQGQRVVFLRCGTEHHSLGLFPRALREPLGCSSHTSCMSFGVEVGSYRQLRDAVTFLSQRGVTFVQIPPDLHPGMDYAVYARDPDGHLIQLYYFMEQVGWKGEPRPRELRRRTDGDWPETLDPLSDTYADQTFQGPLG